MPYYRRLYIPGSIYFFTVVTYQRRKILTSDLARDILRKAYHDTQEKYPFESLAICLLPDHLHCLWQLPENDFNFSIRWASIKGNFSRHYRQMGGEEGDRNSSHIAHREVAIWQRRFWEHCIRNEEDLQKHIDYTHFNPVHHGYVDEIEKWKWSTFHKYQRNGWYPKDWGEKIPDSLIAFDHKQDFE